VNIEDGEKFRVYCQELEGERKVIDMEIDRDMLSHFYCHWHFHPTSPISLPHPNPHPHIDTDSIIFY